MSAVPSLKFDYTKIGRKVKDFSYQYRLIIIAVTLVSTFAVVIFRIQMHTNTKINEATYNEKLTQIKPIKFNYEIITAIKELRDLNIETGPEFPSDRENPFN